MEFLPIPSDGALSDEARTARNQQLDAHGRPITNTRATLLGHVPSFRAYLEWYTLRDELAAVLGDAGVSLFAYAISDENGSTVCSLFFRRVLLDAGRDPEGPPRGQRERLLAAFGRQLARDPHAIPDELYDALSAEFSAPERVLLVAFAGLMVATNVFNTVGRVPLDDDLRPHRDREAEVEMDSLSTGAE
ncbi:MAG: hypothetical protein JWR33_2079 [Naasia sp.]|jgi:alkylhydroperoxidase family enzyme|uniref:carboxymuconolactone decarboxylase family protein n=1 Tax=Naasia sp. TaxID=2546198 RepID=UPI0026327D17|nr:hypothetical protein [Naasia sp.]MCU1571338.1 hypothetical protein [Naasia sp.]